MLIVTFCEFSICTQWYEHDLFDMFWGRTLSEIYRDEMFCIFWWRWYMKGKKLQMWSAYSNEEHVCCDNSTFHLVMDECCRREFQVAWGRFGMTPVDAGFDWWEQEVKIEKEVLQKVWTDKNKSKTA